MTNGINRAVEAAGSQGKLAAKMHVTQQSVQYWHARGYAPLSRAPALSKMFDIPVEDLIDPRYKAVIPLPKKPKA